MAKLFPPIVEGTIPAFYSNGMVNITIPFSMNKAVNKNQIKGIAVKVKSLQSSSYLFVDKNGIFNLDLNPYVTIIVDSNYFIQGQFYKFQIAYIDINDEIGYYSNVTVGKYTSQPSINIEGLEPNKNNNHIYNYYGYYKNNDVTENVYSYRFDLYNENNEIIITSGDLIHDSNNDDNLGESTDVFILSRDLGNNIYYLQYTITTINNLILQTEKYALKQSLSIDSDIDTPILKAIIDDAEKQNGIVRISLISKKAKQVNGNFILYRASKDSNFLDWEECYRFSLNTNNIINREKLWEDKTVQHGKEYKYAIAQYNEAGLYSEKIITEEAVKIDFEDSFLCDAHKQLKIRFNPKISSFKNVNLETKIETIGNKHPFILRNGKVSYKEFPISGLISYLMDTDNTFIKNNYTLENYYRFRTKEKSKNSIPSELLTDLTSNNIVKERDFKIEVLNWLTNGEPKLFRSPTEGNFLVRLMNVSLTPTESLGRMLHTFNCTAYEIAECNYQNLKDLGIIQLNTLSEIQSLYWKTVNLNQYPLILQNNKMMSENLITHPIQNIRFYDMLPGAQILINFEDGNNQIIEIGSTGQYIIENGNIPISGIYLLNSKSNNGLFTYSFYQNISNDFNTYSNVEIFEIPLHQFIGKTDIIKELLYINDGSDRNIKLDIIAIPRIKAFKRPIEEIRKDNDIYYRYNGQYEEQIQNFDYSTLYCIYEYQYDENNNKKLQKLGYNSFKQIFDQNTKSLKWIKVNEFDEQELDFSITLGSSKIEIKDTYDFFNEPKNLDFFSIIENYDENGNPIKNSELCIKSGNGVITEITYILKSSEYLIENQMIYNVINAKNIYIKEKNNLENMYNIGCSNENDNIARLEFMNNIIIQQEKVKESYSNYINTLLAERQRQDLVEGNINDEQKQY